jgi:hypothetical protein
MIRHIRTDWEKAMQEIIQLYAAAADELYKLDSSSGTGPDPNPVETSQSIRDKLTRGSALYGQWKGTPPKGNVVKQTRFSAYRVSTSTTFGLLNLYFELITWINKASSHQTTAIKLASQVQSEYVPWFLVMREIPVIGRGNYVATSSMVRRMADNSVALLLSSRAEIALWSTGD